MSDPNRLIHEPSPYLQQHAYNPVDWYFTHSIPAIRTTCERASGDVCKNEKGYSF